MTELKTRRLNKRRELLAKYSPTMSWTKEGKTSGIYHNYYIIDEDSTKWLLTQSFSRDRDMGNYFFGETLKIIEYTKWYNWMSPYRIVSEPYGES